MQRCMSLTKNERDIAKLICQEKSTREIAAILSLSPRTIEGYRSKVLEKLDCKSVMGLVKLCMKMKGEFG